MKRDVWAAELKGRTICFTSHLPQWSDMKVTCKDTGETIPNIRQIQITGDSNGRFYAVLLLSHRGHRYLEQDAVALEGIYCSHPDVNVVVDVKEARDE